jgi:type I restriction enzyme S subunit
MREHILLGKEVELITKGTTPTTLGKEFTNSGIPFLRAQNVINGKVQIEEDLLFIDAETHNKELKRSQIRKGDLLLTIAGTIGRTAIVDVEKEGINCNQAVAIIRLGNSKIHPQFLKWFIESSNAQRQFSKGKVTATISNLSLTQIKKLKIPLPPLPTQKKIAALLDEADKLRRLNAAVLEKYDALTEAVFLEMFGDPVRNPNNFQVY